MSIVNTIKQVHEKTGAGFMDAKKALEITGGDVSKAIASLQEKGFSIARKKAARITKAGRIESYLHTNGRIGVLLEVTCETEFAATTQVFRDFAHNIAMHIAAMNPTCISCADQQAGLISDNATGRAIEAQDDELPFSEAGVTELDHREKRDPIQGLLEQPYYRDQSRSVRDVLVECIAILRENITISRFVRFEKGDHV